MIQVGMFTWNGTLEEAKAYAKKYEASCKKNGLKFMSVYAPLQEPYHYAFIIDNEKQDMSDLMKPFQEAGYKPPQMGTWIAKYYAKMEW